MFDFDDGFYHALHGASSLSAKALVPSLVRLLQPRSVIDVGCGTGLWLKEFVDTGLPIAQGVEGPWLPEALLSIPADLVLRHDLSEGITLDCRFDLVICLGVANYLGGKLAKRLVETLTGLGSVVLFSPSGPGKRSGENRQTDTCELWNKLFAERGFEAFRGFAKHIAREGEVDSRYTREMVFYRDRRDRNGVDLDMRHLDGPPKAVALDRVQPVVMTCARDVELTRRFVASYATAVGPALRQPVVSVDVIAEVELPHDYLRVLRDLWPASVVFHSRTAGAEPYQSIVQAAYGALECGLSQLGDGGYLLFLEDDIQFAANFVSLLSELQLKPDTGLCTLYLPFGGFGGTEVRPRRFFGTQCVLFPHRPLQAVVAERPNLQRWQGATYDQQWARILREYGYRLYCSPSSYVQHMGTVSRIGSGAHRSDVFIE
jgi:hypothetical protein